MDEPEDLSKLTDEELDKRIAGEEPTDSPEPAEAPKEEPKEEPKETQEEEPKEEVEEEPAPEPETPNEEPEEKPPSRRETLRIQSLLKKYGPPPEQPQEAPSQPSEALDYQTALDADPELIKQLEADRDSVGKSQYQAGVESTRAEIRTSEWRTLLNIDAPATEAKYPWLNPKDTENFSPAQADAINEEYKSIVGYDERTGLVARPDIRYSDFVEARVEQARDLARTMNADTAKNIAKQAAQTGLRPDGSSAKSLNLNKPAHLMSDEELDAKLKQSGFGTK